MGWDGSGNFTRTNGVNTGSTTWTKDKNASTKITSARHDTHDQDLADGIDNCLTKDGQNAATGDIDMGGFLIRNHGATGKNLPIMDAGDDLPTISGGSFTYNEQRTEYVRTGKVINFVVVIKGFYAATATGTIKITHQIPYTPMNLTVPYPCTVHHANMSTDAVIQAAVNQSGEIALYEVTANGTQTALDGSDLNGTIVQIIITGTFIKS